MKIHEAAAAAGLSVKQIRDYEKAGLLPATQRDGNNYRHYDADAVARLRFIQHARAVGFSLRQIGALLRLQDDPNRSSAEVKALTGQHSAALEAQIATLTAMVARLQRWHDHCSGDGTGPCAILDGLS